MKNEERRMRNRFFIFILRSSFFIPYHDSMLNVPPHGPAESPPIVEELSGPERLGDVPIFGVFAASAVFGQCPTIAAGPLFLCDGRSVRLDLAAVWPRSITCPLCCRPPILSTCLADGLEHFRVAAVPGLPPFQGGAAGLFSYDLCHYLERLPRPRYNDLPIPDLAVGLYDWVISFDHWETESLANLHGLSGNRTKRPPPSRRRAPRPGSAAAG